MDSNEFGHEPQPMVACLTYRSKAAAAPSDSDLDALVSKARARNRRMGVTGMLLYEDGHFLQTLEGPPKGLSAIWSDIRRDERHREIEVLTEHLVAARLFSDWDLLLYRRLEESPKTIRDKLRRKHPLARYVEPLRSLALNADEPGLNEVFAKLSQRWSADEIVMHLIEPAGRALGNLWLADECSEFDLTLALGMLQMAAHAVRYTPDPDEIRSKNYTILLATAPGESHMLGSSLLADQFHDAGWSVEMTFPGSNDALANQLSDQKPDAVDISLSDALPRHSQVPDLRQTVKQSRIAVPDQPLIISVGGRLFAEAVATAEHVGADHARKTLARTRIKIGQLLDRTKVASGEPARRSLDLDK